MIKIPKYKKGYTWRHHLDEWWDRAGTEFKVKLFCFVVIGLLVSAAGTIFWVSQKMERESFMEIAKEAKIKAAAEADGLIQNKVSDNRGEVKPGDVRVIYRSQTFPTTGYAVSHDLTPALQTQIAQAFFTFNWEGSSLAKGFSKSGYARFVPITFREDWSVIRQVDEASDASLICP